MINFEITFWSKFNFTLKFNFKIRFKFAFTLKFKFNIKYTRMIRTQMSKTGVHQSWLFGRD